MVYTVSVGAVTQDEILDRLEGVYLTTHTFLDAGLKMMLAWVAVVAPLLTDLGYVAAKAWVELDNVQRATAGAALMVIWGVITGRRRICYMLASLTCISDAHAIKCVY